MKEARQAAPKPAISRSGRPPNAMAGEVEERIIEAAMQVFLARGFDAATLDEIAATAHAGKATLYARYPGKEALFTSVCERKIERTFTLDHALPRSAPIEQRLSYAGSELIGRMLTAEVVGFMRVLTAAAPRFPELARRHHDTARRRASDMLARILAEELRPAEAPPPDPAEQEELLAAAHLFFDLLISPLQFRAIMGGDMAELRAEMPGHVARAVKMFMAAGAIRPPAE